MSNNWKQSLLCGGALALGLMCAPADLFAFGSFPGQVPNGNENSCSTCHFSPGGGGARNAFGVAFESNGKTWDATLAAGDADGDGFSNGEELGDPDGTWTPGSTPGPFLSNPAQKESVPMDTPEPDMGGGDPDMGGGDPDMGGGDPDMGGGDPDMGGGDPDMGNGGNNTTPANNNTPANNATPGNNNTPANNTTPGETTPGDTTPPPSNTGDDDEPVCSQVDVAGGAPAGKGFGLLALLGFGFFMRRRR